MTDRTQLIAEAQAREPDAFIPDNLNSPGRFDGCGDRPLAQALDILTGEGWADDEYGSATEPPYLYIARVGRFLYSQDGQGFVDAAEYPSAEDADAKAQEATFVEETQVQD